jgi:lipopolysaccharide transport system ATP-binding protein
VIRADGLGKKYVIRHAARREQYATLRDTVVNGIKGVGRRLAGGPRDSHPSWEDFWALREVSFEADRGEVIGIIGRNGAGKSTLLKILSRITEPTAGRIELGGRVASLLEVGTGFHAELTGRENVYLNGSILGMSRAEIRRTFDEIVSFAEVERFLDTPVKRYSSGMYMRLAFSVAVHLRSEILVVDEVLAVGDAQFQKKCFDRLQSVGREGRCILFVSHNLASMRQICTRGVVLDHGRVAMTGEINAAVDEYVASRDHSLERTAETGMATIADVRIEPAGGGTIKTFDPVRVRVRLRAKHRIVDPGLYVGFLTKENLRLAGLDFKDFRTTVPIEPGESVVIGFDIDQFPLMPGSYELEIHLQDGFAHRFEPAPVTFPFEVVESPVYSTRKLDHWFGYTGLRAAAIVER